MEELESIRKKLKEFENEKTKSIAQIPENLSVLVVEDTLFNQMLAVELLKSHFPSAYHSFQWRIIQSGRDKNSWYCY